MPAEGGSLFLLIDSVALSSIGDGLSRPYNSMGCGLMMGGHLIFLVWPETRRKPDHPFPRAPYGC